MKTPYAFLCLVVTVLMTGCNNTATQTSTHADPLSENGNVVFISITSDPAVNPQSVDMAMKFAGFSLDEGRDAVLFFNVKSVVCPKKDFADNVAFQENASIKSQLADLIKRGADVHVCPICMKAVGIEAEDLVEGAKVTTRPSLFAKVGKGAFSMTY